MRIPIITVMAKQEPLVESALAAIGRRDRTIPLRGAEMPGGVELDPDFAAVPLGSGEGWEASLAEFGPTSSPQFAVRGFIDADDPTNIPHSVGGQPIFADPVIAPFLTCIGTPPVGGTADVRRKLSLAALAARGLNGTNIAVAIMDTGINLQYLSTKTSATPLFDAAASWTPNGSTTAPGTHPVAHGTMCAFDVLLAAPRATLLDFPILGTPVPGGAMTGSTLSVALVAYAQLIAFWAVAFAPGGAAQYRGLVVNNSWGIFHPSWDFPAGHPGRYIDNPNHPFNIIVSVLARSGADILFAAGNCGASCPDGRCRNNTTQTITGAAATSAVFTLAGCDINDLRVGYSSQGPSIAGMLANKPDATAYTHFLGSEVFGTNTPDSGTSAACPVAAGCIAAIRTNLSPQTVPPANLFAQLRSTARKATPGASWNGDYGYGIIDADAAARSLGV